MLRSLGLGDCDAVTFKPFCSCCTLDDERANFVLKIKQPWTLNRQQLCYDNLKSHNSERTMSHDCVGYWQRYYTACIRLHNTDMRAFIKLQYELNRTNRRGRKDSKKLHEDERKVASLNEEKKKEIRQSLDKWEGLSGIAPFYSVPRP